MLLVWLVLWLENECVGSRGDLAKLEVFFNGRAIVVCEPEFVARER